MMVECSVRVVTFVEVGREVVECENLFKFVCFKLVAHCGFELVVLQCVLPGPENEPQPFPDFGLVVLPHNEPQSPLYLRRYRLTYLVVLVYELVVILELKITLHQQFVPLLQLFHFHP